jgi:hypothetical protein
MPCTHSARFQLLQEQGADFLLTVKANQKTLHRQIRSQFQGNRRIPFLATDHEVSRGRYISWTLRAKQAPEHIREAWVVTSWIVEVAAVGSGTASHFRRLTWLFSSSPPLGATAACAQHQKPC